MTNWITEMNRCTGPKDWREAHGYYPTDQPCVVCGTTSNTGIESRFGYTVCETHSRMSPADISHFVFQL